MTMLEQQLEAQIVSAIEALGLSGLTVRGAWQSVFAGNVKNLEEPEDAAILDVAVSPRSFDSFAHPAVTFDVALSLTIRSDVYPSGAALSGFAGPVLDLISSWNLALFANGSDCGLAVEGVFAPGGLQLMGGSAPDYGEGRWTIGINFTLKGTLLSGFTTNQQEDSNV